MLAAVALVVSVAVVEDAIAVVVGLVVAAAVVELVEHAAYSLSPAGIAQVPVLQQLDLVPNS